MVVGFIQVNLIDAGFMRNWATTDQIREWTRVAGVEEGAVRVVFVWEMACALVVPTDSSVGQGALGEVVSE